MDYGKLSTALITIAIIVLSVIIAQPSLLSDVMGAELYAKYGALLVAILVAVFNYMNPRQAESESDGA
jgi:hypothetical protein